MKKAARKKKAKLKKLQFLKKITVTHNLIANKQSINNNSQKTINKKYPQKSRKNNDIFRPKKYIILRNQQMYKDW